MGVAWERGYMVRYNHFMFCTACSYIKVGDNIVYIHAGALEMMIMSKDSLDCFMHFVTLCLTGGVASLTRGWGSLTVLH